MDDDSINFIHINNAEEKKLSCWKLALVIIPMCNNCKTSVMGVVKIFIKVIWEVNFTISLSNLGFYMKKIKLGSDQQILRHQIEIDNNPC